MKIINPATESVLTEMEEDNTGTLQHKLEKLRAAWPAWSTQTLEHRTAVIRHFVELLDTHREELAATLTSEVGKPLQQSHNEVNGAIARINWLTEHAARALAPELMTEAPGLTERIVHEPLGVICNISAWNYPYLVGVNVFVPALLAGNAVFYKPSEYATLTGLRIADLLKQAGVPDGIFETAIGGAAVGEALLDLPLDGYYFTGSYKTGKYIYERVARKMVPCQLELGGKDPLYVTDGVTDIPAIAAATADGAFYNNGQSCCSVERIYVQESVYDAYVDAFVKEVSSWRVGEPTEEGIYIGPLSRAMQPAFLETQINDAISKGAKVLTGGAPVKGTGYYFQPTVVVDVDHRMQLMREESFGPVIGIMKVKDDAEAIALMQDSEYGLTAAVYSADQQRAEQILAQLDSGSGYWNCCDRVSAALPWSGRRNSGFGSTLSNSGLRAFTKPKSYHLRQPG